MISTSFVERKVGVVTEEAELKLGKCRARGRTVRGRSTRARTSDVELERAIDAVLDDPKAVFRFKLLRATRRLIAARGLNVSIDEIAEAAEVNKRTLFRHVESRDVLVADALSSALDWFDDETARTVAPPPDLPLADWIAGLALRVMRAQIGAGRGYWQLAAANDDDLPPELAKVNVRRRNERRASNVLTAATIWSRSGGEGRCPEVIVDGVGIAISSFSTRSMVDDAGRDVEAVARSIGAMLAALVESQLVAQATRSPGRGRTTARSR